MSRPTPDVVRVVNVTTQTEHDGITVQVTVRRSHPALRHVDDGHPQVADVPADVRAALAAWLDPQHVPVGSVRLVVATADVHAISTAVLQGMEETAAELPATRLVAAHDAALGDGR